MARTKAEIISDLARRKEKKILQSFGWSDLVAAIQAWNGAERQAFVDMVKSNNSAATNTIHQALMAKARADAQTLVEGYLADDQLSLTEIDDII